MSRTSLAAWGVLLLGAAVALGAATMLQGGPFPVDEWWAGVLSAPPEGPRLVVSLALDRVGGGWWAVLVVPLAIAAVLLALRRRWGALCFAVASVASAVLVQVLKAVFGRVRPEDILVAVDEGSFPSGHVANAATIAAALCVLFRSAWVLGGAAVWTAAMAFARTYLSAHWLSDTLGGALVGVGTVLVVAAILLPAIDRERTAVAASRRARASDERSSSGLVPGANSDDER